MRNILILFLTVVIFVFNGCSGSPKISKDPSVVNLKGQKVLIKSKIPFANESSVKQAVKSECNIQSGLSNSIKKHSKNHHIDIAFDNNASIKSNKYYLAVEIVEAISKRYALGTHRKNIKIQGSLYKDSKKIASFRGMRHSSGGKFGFMRGSCSVINSTIKVLGKDIAEWLNNPVDGASLGDLK